MNNVKNITLNTRDINIGDILLDKEGILFSIKPKKWVYILTGGIKYAPYAMILSIICIFITFLTKKYFEELSSSFIFFLIFFYFMCLLPMWAWIINILKKGIEYKNIDYIITNKRIIIKTGIIGIQIKTINYTEVLGITSNIDIIGKIFKTGDVNVFSHNNSTVLKTVSNPYLTGKMIEQIYTDNKL